METARPAGNARPRRRSASSRMCREVLVERLPHDVAAGAPFPGEAIDDRGLSVGHRDVEARAALPFAPRLAVDARATHAAFDGLDIDSCRFEQGATVGYGRGASHAPVRLAPGFGFGGKVGGLLVATGG